MSKYITPTSRDVSNYTLMIENQIKMLTAEIVRLSSMSYASWGNKAAIRSLDDQIVYLEGFMAEYEKDQKKSI